MAGLRPLGYGIHLAPRERREELRSGRVDVGQITQIVPESDWRTQLQVVNAGPAPVLVSNTRDDLLAVPPRGLRIPADLTPVTVPPGATLYGSVQYTLNALRCGFSHYPSQTQTVEIVAASEVAADETFTLSAWVLAPAGAPFWFEPRGRSTDLSGYYPAAAAQLLTGTGSWVFVSQTVSASSFSITPTASYRPGVLIASNKAYADTTGNTTNNENSQAWNYGPVFVDFVQVTLASGAQLIADPGFDTGDTSNVLVAGGQTLGIPNSEFTNNRGTSTRPHRWLCYLDSVGGTTDTDSTPPTGASVSGGVLSIPAAGTTHTREVWSEALRATSGQTWSYAVSWTNPAGLSHSIMAVGAYNAAGTWISDVFFVDDVTVGVRTASGSFVTPANTASLRWRLHNYQNASGTITVDYARLNIPPTAPAPTGVITGRDGYRGVSTLTYAETLLRES